MRQNYEIAAVVRVDLVSVRIIGDYAKIQLIYLTTLLWKNTRWMVVGFYGAHC